MNGPSGCHDNLNTSPIQSMAEPMKSRNLIVLFVSHIQEFALSSRVSRSLKYLCSQCVVHLVRAHHYLIENIWRKIISPPPFDPNSPEFKNELNQLQTRLDPLNSEVNHIPFLFLYIKKFPGDIKYLKDLNEEISTKLKRLEFFVNGMSRYYPEASQEELLQIQMGYQSLHREFELKIGSKKENIERIFNEIIKTLRASFASAPPRHIVQKLFQDRTTIYTLFKEGISLRDCGWIAVAEISQNESRQDVSQVFPFALKNIGNSCYLASTLQVLFNFEEVIKRLCRSLNTLDPNSSKEVLLKKEQLQDLLIHLCKAYENQSLSYSEYIAATIEQPNLFSLRDCLFNSNLHSELNPNDIEGQMDPAFVIELLMREILDYKFMTQKVFSSEHIKGRIFYGPSEPNYTLPLPINDGRTLDTLIRNYFKAQTEQGAKKFVLSEGIDMGNESLESKDNEMHVKQYEHIVRLRTLPEVMAIQIKRFNSIPAGELAGQVQYQEVKYSTPIRLPENGLIDFTEYYGPMGEEADSHAKPLYEIMGYVTHINKGDSMTTKSGHYVSYVKKGDRFWYCNDMDTPSFKEISRKEFYGEEQSYMLILRRVKDSQ